MTTIEIEMNETAPTFEKRLKDHPELRSRFESIISIAEGKSEGPIQLMKSKNAPLLH
jgi:hypothetical protein